MEKKVRCLFVFLLVITTAGSLVDSLKNTTVNATVSNIPLRSQSSEWIEIQKLLPSDAIDNERFGYSVAISYDTALIGAYCDDENGVNSGSAYVFIWNGTTWIQQVKLTALDGHAYSWFGFAVALDGDTALIGAPGDDVYGHHSGSAYVFTRSETTWMQQAKLLASDGAEGDDFGYSVALDDDTAFVGAITFYSSSPKNGTVYVFTRTNATWTQQQKLTPSESSVNDYFGFTLALDSDVAVIGTPGDIENGYHSGAAYVFMYTGTTWIQEAKLLASDGAAEDDFGRTVAIDGNCVLIGAALDDDNGDKSGSAYVFVYVNTNWIQQAKLLASDGAEGDEFGWFVSLDDDTAIIGVHRDDDNGVDSGSAYVYTRSGSMWIQQTKLLASDGATGDTFGCSISFSGDIILIGAYFEDNYAENSGSVYVFIEESENHPPDKPDQPTGETNGDINTVYIYTTQTDDLDGHQVYYNWSWGDGNYSGWLGPYNSGVEATAGHTWITEGDYSVKVKAKDTYDAESDWSDPLPITMPCTYNLPLEWFWERLFERFPNAFPILRHLMRY